MKKRITTGGLILLIALIAGFFLQRQQPPAPDVPDYSGQTYIVLNDNKPEFTQAELESNAYEFYSELDYLGRCGYAEACVGPEMMPTEDRESISQVKPSGWVQGYYDFVDGGVLYNRCHLIGYQLTGENANEKNLITGTRYFNVEGMLPFENEVADYVRRTGNHVMYRVTPCYEGEELVARGVKMEAMSQEDGGAGVCFCVYVYNIQPGVEIDYATGENRSAQQDPTEAAQKQNYILNTNSKKFHSADCAQGQSVKDSNKEEYFGFRQDLLDQGYTASGCCKP